MKVSNLGDSDNHSLIFVYHFKELECLEQFAVAGVLSVGAALRGRPPPGTHIGVPLRLLQRLLATIGMASRCQCSPYRFIRSRSTLRLMPNSRAACTWLWRDSSRA